MEMKIVGETTTIEMLIISQDATAFMQEMGLVPAPTSTAVIGVIPIESAAGEGPPTFWGEGQRIQRSARRPVIQLSYLL
eukprot:scaffold10939_cov105-Cylindrotheca_fusiformis.AAC.7